MGISFHITSVREGTIFNVMQFLSLERVTGTLTISFGRDIPQVSIYFVAGNITTAEFGAIVGDAVLDVLLCQEFAIKEVNFDPGRMREVNEEAIIVHATSLSGAMLNVSKDVDKCEARSLIYGMMPMKDRNSSNINSLLHLLNDFNNYENTLKKAPRDGKDKAAPLKQCVLITRALRGGVLAYQTPMISLKAIRPLIDIVQPLSEKETNNLRGYMKSLLPHPKATHISIERFYAFSSAIESIAQRRSGDVGERARKTIRALIQQATKSGEAAQV
ncbi:MAG: DUF4388 domain-containing protein [Cyanobacteria bacterium HKST-UBA02]|nr:DUF4388 domain-containing protein [Cyanobacteria bacterium HKST-UBA02]